ETACGRHQKPRFQVGGADRYHETRAVARSVSITRESPACPDPAAARAVVRYTAPASLALPSRWNVTAGNVPKVFVKEMGPAQAPSGGAPPCPNTTSLLNGNTKRWRPGTRCRQHEVRIQ